MIVLLFRITAVILHELGCYMNSFPQETMTYILKHGYVLSGSRVMAAIMYLMQTVHLTPGRFKVHSANLTGILRIVFAAAVLLLFPFGLVFSQGELDLQPRLLYKNEQSYGVYLNSNGLGAGYRYGQRISARKQYLYEADILGIKHPKEIKVSHSIYSNRSFVYGKMNSFVELRAMYGRQNELFRKNDRGGVSVRYFYSGGPALGFIKPIYYEVIYPIDPTTFQLKTEKFPNSIHYGSNIYGKASSFKGMNEISVVPGVSAKTGFSFEYSALMSCYIPLKQAFRLMFLQRKSRLWRVSKTISCS